MVAFLLTSRRRWERSTSRANNRRNAIQIRAIREDFSLCFWMGGIWFRRTQHHSRPRQRSVNQNAPMLAWNGRSELDSWEPWWPFSKQDCFKIESMGNTNRNRSSLECFNSAKSKVKTCKIARTDSSIWGTEENVASTVPKLRAGKQILRSLAIFAEVWQKFGNCICTTARKFGNSATFLAFSAIILSVSCPVWPVFVCFVSCVVVCANCCSYVRYLRLTEPGHNRTSPDTFRTKLLHFQKWKCK